MHYRLQTDFETFWKTFDPEHQWNREEKKFIHDLFDTVSRINFEAPAFQEPTRTKFPKRMGGYHR
jgi:hypothetical protein